jgi:HAD superfamily hydrolase (TIGR01509 family)
MISAAAWDFDGTIAETKICWKESSSYIAQIAGINQIDPEVLRRMSGRSDYDAMEIFLTGHNSDISQIHKFVYERKIFTCTLAHLAELKAGLIETLDLFERKNIINVIVTQSPRMLVEAVLDLYGLTNRFAFMVTAENIIEPKPHSEPYDRARSILNLSPQSMIGIEDSEHGVKAVLAAGMKCIAVPNHPIPNEPFHGAHITCSSLVDLSTNWKGYEEKLSTH